MKPSPAILALAVAGVVSFSGCAGALVDNRQQPSRPSTRASLGPELPNAADPDYADTHSSYREEMSRRSVVSPALGIESEDESSAVQQAGFTEGVSSVAGSISSGVSKGLSKVGDAIRPEPKVNKALEPTSVFNDAKPGPELYMAMARLHEQSGKLQEAQVQYQKALALEPTHMGALLGYAHLKDRGGDFPSAIQLYQRAASAHPAEASVYNDMGLCFARNGKLNEAIASLGHAVKLQPKKLLYRNNIAIVLTETGQIETAFLHLRAVQPEAMARYNLGQLLLRKGDRQQAAQQFALALRADPAQKESRAWLAELVRTGVTLEAPAARTAARPQTPTQQAPAPQPAETERPAPVAPRRSVPQSPVQTPPAIQTQQPQRPLMAGRSTGSSAAAANDLQQRYGNFPVPAGRLSPNPRNAAPDSRVPATTPSPLRSLSPTPVPPQVAPMPPAASQPSGVPTYRAPSTVRYPRMVAPEPQGEAVPTAPEPPTGAPMTGPSLSVPMGLPADDPNIELLPPILPAPLPQE